MYVIKRNGSKEPVHFDKITSRIKKLAWGLSHDIDPIQVAKKVCVGVYAGVTTSELDELAAQTAAHMVTVHPDYGLLAARIEVSNLQKNTKKVFSEVISDLYSYINPRSGEAGPLISDRVYKIVQENKEKLDAAIVYGRDYGYDYFGIKTLTKSYLLKLNRSITQQPQLALCFLLITKDDSIEEIYGGIVAKHCVRGMGSYIKDDGIESIYDLYLALKLCNKLIIEIKKFDAALNVDNECNLTLSIYVSIFGHDKIKRGILEQLFIDELESIRNNGATILSRMEVQAAKIFVEFDKSQDIEAGNGITSVCVITGSLLEVAEGIHPVALSDVWKLACEKSQIILPEILQNLVIERKKVYNGRQL
eukprot:501970_1